jgi:pimeloyl-ACP methyl ester carboxylesterase
VADSFFELRDGRRLAWCDYGVPDGTPILRIQGAPGARFFRYPHPELWEELGVRVLMADRPGYGGSSRLPGPRARRVADDLVELPDHEGIEKIRVVGYSGGGPHVLALCPPR